MELKYWNSPYSENDIKTFRGYTRNYQLQTMWGIIVPHHIKPKAGWTSLLGFLHLFFSSYFFYYQILFPVFGPTHRVHLLLQATWRETSDMYLNYWLHIHIKNTVGILWRASCKYQLAPLSFSGLINSSCWISVLWNSKQISFFSISILFSFHSVHTNKSNFSLFSSAL